MKNEFLKRIDARQIVSHYPFTAEEELLNRELEVLKKDEKCKKDIASYPFGAEEMLDLRDIKKLDER